MTSPAEILLAEMRGKLDGQLATLESARTRAAVAVSASGIVAGLFAQHLTAPIGNWAIAALAAFVVGSLPAVWILLPHEMTLNPNAGKWIEWSATYDAFVRGNAVQPTPNPLATSDLGGSQLAVSMLPSMQIWYEKNGPLLKKVHRCTTAAFAAVVVQLVCWGGAAIH
jgi:hypothetical protein